MTPSRILDPALARAGIPPASERIIAHMHAAAQHIREAETRVSRISNDMVSVREGIAALCAELRLGLEEAECAAVAARQR